MTRKQEVIKSLALKALEADEICWVELSYLLEHHGLELKIESKND